MTVSTTANRIVYTGDGVTLVFAFPYKVIDSGDLVVYVNGAEVITGYTVSPPSPTGANITFAIAPLAGQSVVIFSDPAQIQSTSLPSTGPFPAKAVETAFDKVTLLIQRLSDLVSRSLRLADSDSTTTDLRLPTPAPNMLIGWNDTATGFQNLDASTLATIVAFGTARADAFTGNGVQTVFVLSASPGSQANLDVAIGGATQTPGVDYTWVSGTSVTFSTAPPNGVTILARYMQALPQGASDSAASIFIASGVGAVISTAQNKARQIVNAKDYGALPGNTNGQNRIAVQAAISAVDAAGGGIVVVDYDICYGVKTRTPSTWPDFTGMTKPIMVRDDSRGFTQDPLVYPSAYDGMQYRLWSFTPQTTSPGQHDGNVLFIRGNWNPNVFTTNDANLAAVGHPSRAASDNYRNGFTTGADGSAGWSFMQGTLAGAAYTKEELSNLQIIKFSMPGDTLGDYVPVLVERKTGWMCYAKGTNTPQAKHHFGSVAGSPAGYDMMIESPTVLTQLVFRGLSGPSRDVIVRNNNGTFGINCPTVGDAIQVFYNTRRVWFPGSVQFRVQAQNYSASMTIDSTLGNICTIEPLNSTAFTIQAPTSPDLGMPLHITIINNVGAPLGVATWAAVFKLSAWTQPATGFSRTITFHYVDSVWRETSRNTVDIPN